MRKGQIQAQVFIYVLMIVIVGLILVYGYKAIKDFGSKTERIDLIESQNSIRNSIEKNMGYMVVKKFEASLPDPYTHLCFASSRLVRGENLGWSSLVNNPALKNTEINNRLSIIQDSIESKYNRNMFYFPDGTEALNVGNIEVNQELGCFKKVGGVVTLRLEGLGDSVRISEWVR